MYIKSDVGKYFHFAATGTTSDELSGDPQATCRATYEPHRVEQLSAHHQSGWPNA